MDSSVVLPSLSGQSDRSLFGDNNGQAGGQGAARQHGLKTEPIVFFSGHLMRVSAAQLLMKQGIATAAIMLTGS